MFENCKFNSEKYKKNCARLALSREFDLLDSYTVETSCFGYEVKGSGTKEHDAVIEQFSPQNFLEFGKTLLKCMCKHLYISVTDLDRQGPLLGM